MPRIVETIITTSNAKGETYIAPLGLIRAGEHWVIAALGLTGLFLLSLSRALRAFRERE